MGFGCGWWMGVASRASFAAQLDKIVASPVVRQSSSAKRDGTFGEARDEGLLSPMESVERGLPVIPIPPRGLRRSQIPVFFSAFAWVDLRSGAPRRGPDLLQWGITGKKPSCPKDSESRQIPGGAFPTPPQPPLLPARRPPQGRNEDVRNLEAMQARRSPRRRRSTGLAGSARPRWPSSTPGARETGIPRRCSWWRTLPRLCAPVWRVWLGQSPQPAEYNAGQKTRRMPPSYDGSGIRIAGC